MFRMFIKDLFIVELHVVYCRYFFFYIVDVFVFFFFQAEDGIRDVAVTGVQTCALPIYLAGYGPVGWEYWPFVRCQIVLAFRHERARLQDSLSSRAGEPSRPRTPDSAPREPVGRGSGKSVARTGNPSIRAAKRRVSHRRLTRPIPHLPIPDRERTC